MATGLELESVFRMLTKKYITVTELDEAYWLTHTTTVTRGLKFCRSPLIGISCVWSALGLTSFAYIVSHAVIPLAVGCMVTHIQCLTQVRLHECSLEIRFQKCMLVVSITGVF